MTPLDLLRQLLIDSGWTETFLGFWNIVENTFYCDPIFNEGRECAIWTKTNIFVFDKDEKLIKVVTR